MLPNCHSGKQLAGYGPIQIIQNYGGLNMCGVAGYFGTNLISNARLESCKKLMERRGPDGNGYFYRKVGNDRNAQILHSRLRILDLDDRSNQPFLTDDDCLSFNGEIYNYLELRDRLKKSGVSFATDGDTEVLAKVIQKFGVDGLDQCEGMWAFAWLDESGLILSRDRFGEKPLYILKDETGLYFGSEPKFIFALIGHTLPVNKNHLLRYMVNGYKALYKSGDTFFEGLKEVPPGSVLKVDVHGVCVEQKYWVPKFNQQIDGMSFGDAVLNAREALINSVELRLRSDVPIAFCLSGGIDSNALIAIAKKYLNYDVHGYTIMNTDERYEEQEMVNASVNALQLRHTEVPINESDFLDNLRKLVKYHDSPVSTITYYAQWQLMEKIAEDGYKVSVSGTAADELFSGYFDHHNFYLASLKNYSDEQLLARKNWHEVVAPIVRNPFLQDADCFIKNPNLRDHIFLDAAVFLSYLNSPWFERFEEEEYSNIILRNRMNNELFHESVPVILHEDDLNAMYYSVENRSPFLDRRLFEVCQSIPTRHLIRNGRAKAVLREAVRGLTPDIILDNPRKVGFNAPILDYLDLNNPKIRSQILADSPIFQLIKRDSIEALLNKAHLPNSQSKFLFYFLNAKMFLEEFSAQGIL
ncbi:asparagine synthase (glutamine-hydrolyzing) [Polynucleobacter sp. MWH-UH19D]|uniref:asparagine synthase (glutamine-hydrolyzing) n=1 Tax=Polynucleobacter sp. MWH-UH19D TaxID=1855610 RepID=UPI0033651AF8